MMAKVSFTKLGLSKEEEKICTTFNYNEQVIEVKQYLPIQDKLALVERVINKALDASSKFYNLAQVMVLLDMEIIYSYSNITFTDKQKEEFLKTYDLLKSNRFFENFYNHMKDDEYNQLKEWIIDALTHIYQYNNSLMGILENSQNQFEGLNLDAEEIRAKLADPNNLSFLKEIAPLLNLAD